MKFLKNKVKYWLRILLRYSIYRRLACFGKNVEISVLGTFIRPEEASIGSNVYIGPRFFISARKLRIGNDVLIGPNVLIECDNHVFDDARKTVYEQRHLLSAKKGVCIGSDVWIGGNVTILAGVKIGDGAIVGAGSVVTKDIMPYIVAAGNPCKYIKDRERNASDRTKVR